MKTLNTIVCLILITTFAFTQQSEQAKVVWTRQLKNLQAIIENKGHEKDIQGRKILYAYYGSKEKYFFTDRGIIIRQDTLIQKGGIPALFRVFKDEIEREDFKLKSYYLFAEWQNANHHIEIIPSVPTEGYYTFRNNQNTSRGYLKLTYKNVYPNIDIEYTLPRDSNGIKYNIIVHPGGELSDIKLLYSGDIKKIEMDNSGNVIVYSPILPIIEHAPKAFTESSEVLMSSFILSGNLIEFFVDNNRKLDKKIIIDPWVNGITVTGNDYGFDVEYDFSQNLYVYSRADGGGLYVSKYSPSGALVWTHIVTTSTWYEGNFLLDKLANKIYISEGFNASGARIYRIDLNGTPDGFMSQQNGSYQEIWDMIYDCKNNRIIGVGGGTNSNINGGLVNITTGVVQAANFTGISGTCQDIVTGCVDNSGNVFVVFCKPSCGPAAINDKLMLLNNTLNGYQWSVTHGMHGFNECSNHPPSYNCWGPGSNAFNALDVNDYYLFYYDGEGIAVYNKATGAMINSLIVDYFGHLQSGGIAVDDCNTIYIGGRNKDIKQYYFNGFTFTGPSTINIGWPGTFVFDIKYDRNTNLLYVAGYNGVAVVYANASAGCINNSLTHSVTCTGPGTGSATVTVNTSLTQATFNYTWYNAGGTQISQTLNSTSNTNTLNNLQNGTYIVQVHVNPLCGPILTDTIVVNCPNCGANVTSTPVSCYGGNNGSATITPVDGQPPFGYTWSTGSNNQTINNLSSGTYSVTFTDASNCILVYQVTVTQPPQLQVHIVPQHVICHNSNDGVATAIVSGGTPPYQAIWNNGQSGLIAQQLVSGTYTITVTDANQCTTTASTIIQNASPLVVTASANPPAICYGNTTQLQAQGAVFYQWQPNTYLSADTGSVVTFESLQPGTYTYTVTGYVPHIGNNIILNGNFELGNNYFNSQYSYNPVSTVLEGEYSITTNPFNVHNGFASCADHTTGSGNMMVVNGSATPNTNVWCQQVHVQPNTDYIFSAWLTSVHSSNPAVLQFSINGNMLGNPFSISSTTCQWNQFFETWNSGTNTTAQICIVNQNTALSGNDFAIDDIYFAPIVWCTATDTVNVTLNPLPNISINGTTPICEGQNTTLTASGGASYVWDNGNNTPSIVVSPNATSTYFVTGTDANGCSSTANFTVTVIPMPHANAGADTSICGLTYQLNATPSVGQGTWSSPQNVTIAPPNNPNATISATQTGQYTLIWTEVNQSCIDADTVIINLTRVPTSSFNVDTIACFGNSSVVQFTGYAETNSVFTWNWGGLTAQPGTGIGPHTVSSNQSGVYTISLTVSTNGCESLPTTVLIYNPPPLNISVSTTDVACYGNTTGSILAAVQGGRPPYTFSWSNGNNTPNISNLPAGIYSLTVTDSHGCTSATGTTINQPPALIASVNPSQYICMGQPAYLNITASGGTPPYQYFWNGQASTASTVVYPQTTTTYQASVVDANGCSTAILTTTVYVAPPLNVNLQANTYHVCPGDPVMLTPVVWGGVGPPYALYDHEGNLVTPPIYIYPTQGGWYTIRAEDACGSWDTARVYINVYPLPPVNILADVLQGCVPLTVQFNEINPDSGQTYVWNFGDNSNLSLSKNPVHTYTSPGTYDVTITVTSTNGCKNTVVYNDMIQVWAKPNAAFVWSPEVVSEIKPEVQFTNLSSGASWYQWMFGDGDSSSKVHPYHRYPGVGSYQVQLVAVSNKGCTDTVYAIIKVLEQYTFYAPTAFSPDGDRVNDFFYVVAHGIKEEGFYLEIYDRWGEIIWSTNKFYKDLERSEKWDGRAKNNEIVPVGTYTWRCVFRDVLDKFHEETGSINVIR